jgi:hypothetical protein
MLHTGKTYTLPTALTPASVQRSRGFWRRLWARLRGGSAVSPVTAASWLAGLAVERTREIEAGYSVTVTHESSTPQALGASPQRTMHLVVERPSRVSLSSAASTGLAFLKPLNRQIDTVKE